MRQEYKYRANYGTWHWSAIHIIGFVVIAVALVYLYDGGYMLAWFLSLLVALIGLMILSVPRKIVLTDESVEICCVSDMTTIRYDDIASIRIVPQCDMRWFMPIFASIGFLGFYGYFLNLRRLDLVAVYAAKWADFVEITDIFDDKYYVSCDKREELVGIITERLNNTPNDDVQQ